MENKSVLEGLSRQIKYQRLKESIRVAIASSIFDVNHFKIGKTGQTIDDRFNKSTYKDDYKGIIPLHTSEDPDEISQLEADLIEEFKSNSKYDSICDNERTTDKDEMKDSDSYALYMVWN